MLVAVAAAVKGVFALRTGVDPSSAAMLRLLHAAALACVYFDGMPPLPEGTFASREL